MSTESVVTDNPAYMSVSTLVSPASTLQHSSHYDNPDYSRDIPNPMYATNFITSPTPPAPYAKRNGNVNPYASLSGEEELHAKTSTGQYDNLYTFDPTEDDTQSDAGSKLDPLQEAPYVTMKQSDPFPREVSAVENPYEFSPKENASEENPYDSIPGDQDPASNGIYEKLPPEIN